MVMPLKAPVEWFERLDVWCKRQGRVMTPSRQAAIRHILWQFLEQDEAKAEKARKRKRANAGKRKSK